MELFLLLVHRYYSYGVDGGVAGVDGDAGGGVVLSNSFFSASATWVVRCCCFSCFCICTNTSLLKASLPPSAFNSILVRLLQACLAAISAPLIGAPISLSPLLSLFVVSYFG